MYLNKIDIIEFRRIYKIVFIKSSKTHNHLDFNVFFLKKKIQLALSLFIDLHINVTLFHCSSVYFRVGFTGKKSGSLV